MKNKKRIAFVICILFIFSLWLYITVRGNYLQILGVGEEYVEIQKEGADLKIGFNPKFLTDALKVISDETVSLSFVNPKSPCFIKDDEDTYLYLILPVNFTED